MPPSSARFTNAWLMAGVAIFAILFAWLGVWPTAAVAGLVFVVAMPAAIAPRGRRLEAASWASSLQPAVILSYLYATWFAAWWSLGHRPRPSLDDPKGLGPLVEAPYIMFAFSLMFGWMICALSGFLLSVSCLALRRKSLPLLALVLSWVAGFLVLRWDPLGVGYWYMD